MLYWGLTNVTLLAGAASSIGSLGAAVAVERDYAKTLCGDDSGALRKLNSGTVQCVKLEFRCRSKQWAASARQHCKSVA